MNPTLLQQPFFQVAMPIIVAMVTTLWALVSTNNRRLDDIRWDLKEFRGEVITRFGQVNTRLDKIDETLTTYGQKIVVLEDRSSPLARR